MLHPTTRSIYVPHLFGVSVSFLAAETSSASPLTKEAVFEVHGPSIHLEAEKSWLAESQEIRVVQLRSGVCHTRMVKRTPYDYYSGISELREPPRTTCR